MRYIKFLVDILHLIVLSCKLTHRSRARSILQVLSFAIAILEDFWRLLNLQFFLQFIFAKVTKYLKAGEIKIFNLSFWTQKSYRNIKKMKTRAAFHIST